MQVNNHIVTLEWRSIFIGALPKAPLNKVFSAEHERSIIQLIMKLPA